MTERRIGIDFGTSTSVIRVRRYEDGKSDDPKTVTFNGAPKVPTLIQTIEDGQACYYGYDADVQKRRATVYRNFKLELESEDAEKQVKARALTAEYLRYLGQVYRHQSEGGFLGDSGDTVKTFVSYPVRWSENTRAFMLQAARDAGFPAVEGLDEAEASIRAVTEQYADLLTGKGYFRADRPCTILLIDMGAGTTDLVLCRHMPGDAAKTEILCTWPQGGEALFGGGRVDALLYKYITDSFPDMQAVARLPLSKFKAWKEELVSPALQRGESVDYFEALKPIEDALDIDLCFEPIDRARFETLAADYLPELPKLVAGALAAAKLDGDAVDLVLLTGGHSQWYFVREMLLGHMPQFGELRLGKIAADPGRIVSIARPEETVALGLVCKSKQLALSKLSDPGDDTDETKHAILKPFGNWHDKEFRKGAGWIELPVVIFGSNPIHVGQRFAFYHDDGTILCTLPVNKLFYNGDEASEVVRTQEYEDSYIPFRVRFSVDDAQIETEDTYREIAWLISEPVSTQTFSKALHDFTHRVDYKWPETLPADKTKAISDSYILLVRNVDGITIDCDCLCGELNAENELNIYKASGNSAVLKWSKATHSTFDCCFTTDGSNQVSVGDIIADAELPHGFTMKAVIDPKVSWWYHLYIVDTNAEESLDIHGKSEANSDPNWPTEAHEQYKLACVYYAKTGEENSAKAVKLFRKAAEQGHPDAQYYLGHCYLNGIGCRPNLVEARKWLTMASQQGVKPADAELRNMRRGNSLSTFPLVYEPTSLVRPVLAMHDKAEFKLADKKKAEVSVAIVGASVAPSCRIALLVDGSIRYYEFENEKTASAKGLYTAIAATYKDFFAVKTDRTVACLECFRGWGEITLRPCEFRWDFRSVAEWRNITAIAGNYNELFGLRGDGTVISSNSLTTAAIAGWTDIVAIACNDEVCDCLLGLRRDGTVLAAGSYNVFGSPIRPDVQGWHDIKAISLGSNHAVGLKQDGTVIATGDNSRGQCEVQNWRNIIAVFAGGKSTVGVKADGTLVMAYRKKSFFDDSPMDISSIKLF